jgi:hypothetical protein
MNARPPFFRRDGRGVRDMIRRHGRRFRRATVIGLGEMHKELIVYLRMHAHDLVKLARQSSDETLSLELEKMAIEMLKRASDLERDSRF